MAPHGLPPFDVSSHDGSNGTSSKCPSHFVPDSSLPPSPPRPPTGLPTRLLLMLRFFSAEHSGLGGLGEGEGEGIATELIVLLFLFSASSPQPVLDGNRTTSPDFLGSSSSIGIGTCERSSDDQVTTAIAHHNYVLRFATKLQLLLWGAIIMSPPVLFFLCPYCFTFVFVFV